MESLATGYQFASNDVPVVFFDIATPKGAFSVSADKYTANDESASPFIAMRNERKSVVSGKSNDAPEDADVSVATVIPSPCFGKALIVADAAASTPE